MAEPESQLNLLAKYFVHGILFSILGLILGLGLVAIFVLLILLGSIIGLLIGLVLFFLVMGWLNSILTGFIWHISIKTDWKNLLVHGLVLSIAFVAVHIPAFVINAIARDLVTIAVVFIIYAFVDGFVARHVANVWQEAEEPLEMVGETPKVFFKSCVKCGRDIPIASETCPYCGAEQMESQQ